MNEDVQGQDLGKVQFTPSGQEGEQGQTQPEYVTVDQARRMTEEAVQQAVSKAQSLVDKSGNRLQEKIQAKLKDLESTLKVQAAAGIKITPEQEQALRQQVMVDALAEVEEPAAQAGQTRETQTQDAQAGQIDPISQAAWELMQERGVEILENDPEAKMLDFSTPYKFLLSVEKAVSTKEQRLQSSSGEEPNKSVPPQARIPGAGSGGPGNSLMPSGTPAIERLDKYFSNK